MRIEDVRRVGRTEMRMVRWIVSKIKNSKLRNERLKINSPDEELGKRRLGWYGHVQ